MISAFLHHPLGQAAVTIVALVLVVAFISYVIGEGDGDEEK